MRVREGRLGNAVDPGPKARLLQKARKRMKTAKLVVEFCEHVSVDSVASMVSGIAAYGNVYEGSSGREFAIEVFRVSKLPDLKRKLLNWEHYGFIRWSEDSKISN